jgi:nucleoside-diphosphate-sugar epimerase
MTVLVTGGTGFVGINIARRLAHDGHRVVCFSRHADDPDSVRDAFVAPVRERVALVSGDVRRSQDIEALWRRYAPSHVIHAAAITPSVDMERSMGGAIVEANVMGTVNMLEAAVRAGARRFVYVSSAGVYGDAGEAAPLTEAAPETGRGLYAVTKHAAEQLCQRYAELHGLETVSVRVGWVYGPMERPLVGSRERMSLVYECVHMALAGREVCLAELDALRDWIYVGDLTRAIAALLAMAPSRRRLYNVAGPRGYTHRELLDTLSRILPVSYRAADDEHPPNVDEALTRRRRGPLSVERLLADTSYRPQIDLETGLRRYVDWLLAARGASS